jgi:hypothetical protein
MQAKASLGNPVLWPLAALLIVALLLVGLTSSASAGNGDRGTAQAAKKKCKRHSKASGQASKRRKCRRHKKPGSRPTTPPAATLPGAPAVLSINPPGFNFGNVEHGGFETCGADPDPNCPTQAFTVTNIGATTSGVPTASLVETKNPEIGGVPAFQITSNSCNVALPPGASCSLTVKFKPNSNAGDEMYSSRLDVTATPGSIASSLLSGMAN